GIGNIVQHVDHARAIHARRIVHPCLLEVEVLAQLPGASLGEILHVVFAAEVQATGGTGFDAGGLEPLAHAVDAERALEHLLGGRIELGNIEGTAAHAVSAADTVLLLKVDDAIRILHDRAIGGTGRQAAGVGAMHALIFAHQQLQRAIFALVFVELDEVPVVPRRRGHRLIAVVEDGLGERIPVPLETCDFTGFAADARGGVDQLADLVVALDIFARSGSGVPGNSANYKVA